MSIFGTDKLLTDQDMGASFVSEKISLERKGGLAIFAVFTGEPEGVLSLESSITGNESNDNDWKIIPCSHTRINFASEIVYNLPTTTFPYVRLSYRFIGGSGVLNASYNTKEIS